MKNLILLFLSLTIFTGIHAQSPTVSTGCVSGNCVNGYGKLVSPNGAIYEGDFVNGKSNGIGKLVYFNGDNYEGNFVNGTREGQGTFTVKKSGVVFTGQFAKGQLNGYGKTIDIIESYEGNWVNGYRTGKGKLTLHTLGKTYEGDFINGRFEGQGTYSNNDGSYYTGGFKNGTENGYGKQFDKGKKLVREGFWQDDVFIGPSKPTTNTNSAKDETAILLKATLNGKFDLMEGAPLEYTLKMKRSNETLRYKIEFINDGTDNFTFKWKETTKNEQSEKLEINKMAFGSGIKYVNFFTVKSIPLPPAVIMFILSRNQYDYLKDNNEIKLDVGNGSQTFIFNKMSFPYLKNYAQNAKLNNLQTTDGQTKVKVLDNRICPLIVEIETPEYTFTLD